MGYDAFISYSHAADGQLAPALQTGLQRLAKPWWRPRALRVFRDETGLTVNPHMWQSIETALRESDWFVVLCSPDAAESTWVNREIDAWIAAKGTERLLPVLTGGSIAWGHIAGDFTPDSTAVPPSLRGVFVAEPRYLDLRWARTQTDLDLRNSRFHASIATLAAPIHGVDRDELESDDVRLARNARRLARTASVLLALFGAAAAVALFVALSFAHRTNQQAQRARRAEALERASERRARASEQQAHASAQRARASAERAGAAQRVAQARARQLATEKDRVTAAYNELADKTKRLLDAQARETNALEAAAANLRQANLETAYARSQQQLAVANAADAARAAQAAVVEAQQAEAATTLARYRNLAANAIEVAESGNPKVGMLLATAGIRQATDASVRDALLRAVAQAPWGLLRYANGPISVSPDGLTVAVSTTSSLEVRNADTWALRWSMQRTYGATFSADSQQIAVGAPDGIEIRNTLSGGNAVRVTSRRVPLPDAIDDVSAVFATSRGVQIVDARTGTRRIDLPIAYVTEVAVSSDSQFLAVAGDKTDRGPYGLYIIDTTSGRMLHTVSLTDGEPATLAFTRRGGVQTVVATFAGGRTATAHAGLRWATDGSIVQSVSAAAGHGTVVLASQDLSTIAYSDGAVLNDAGNRVGTLIFAEGCGQSLCPDPDGAVALLGAHLNMAALGRAIVAIAPCCDYGQDSPLVRATKVSIRADSLSVQADQVAAFDGTQIRRVTLRGHAPLTSISLGGTYASGELTYSPDGKILAATLRTTTGGPFGDPSALRVYDAGTGRLLVSVDDTICTAVRFAPDSRTLEYDTSCVGSAMGRLRAIDTRSGAVRLSLSNQSFDWFSPDGRDVVTTTSYGRVVTQTAWDLNTGRPATLDGLRPWWLDPDITTDMAPIVSADQSIALYLSANSLTERDLRTGRIRRAPYPIPMPSSGFITTDDSTAVLFDGGDIYLIDLNSMRIVGAPLPVESTSGAASNAALSASSNELIVTGPAGPTSGTLLSLPITWTGLADRACAVIGADVTWHTWQQFGAGLPYRHACPGFDSSLPN